MLTAVVGIEVFHLFSSVGLLCEWCCLGDGSIKISLLKRPHKGVCYLYWSNWLASSPCACLGTMFELKIEGENHSTLSNIPAWCKHKLFVPQALFCRFVAVIIQLYGGYFSSASFGASINVGLSTGHDFAVREGSRHFHVFPNGYKRMWDNVEWGFQLTGRPRRCLGTLLDMQQD